MSSKKHRNHTREELLKQRAVDDSRHGIQKPAANIGAPHATGTTILYNPFRRQRFLHKGIVIVRAPLSSK